MLTEISKFNFCQRASYFKNSLVHYYLKFLGFRQGRRASDGLLLLGDNMLKERLQKLAQGSAVPEIVSVSFIF